MRELVSLAQTEQRGGDDASVKRYVQLARRIGMRYQVSLPPEIRRRICRSCDGVLVPGSTARHRVTDGRVNVTCLRCGAIKRYPFRARPKVAA
ncbi:MAG: ribonuclease P [Euryarchaeota archaeon]|nr:ribonuclease P [Euryarchaeota archaeon]